MGANRRGDGHVTDRVQVLRARVRAPLDELLGVKVGVRVRVSVSVRVRVRVRVRV